MRDRRPPTCEWSRACSGMDDLPSGPVFVHAVRRGGIVVVRTEPTKGAPVVTGLTEKEAWVRRIEAPLASKAKALDVLPGMLDAQLPFGVDECAVVFARLIRKNGNGWTATAAVAKRSDARAILDRWAARGCEPHALDQEGLALWTQALLEFPVESTEARRAVVYLGEDRATLALGRGEEVLSSHGLRQFDARQALRLARMAFEGKAEGLLWIWTGPGAEHADAIQRFRADMGDETGRDAIVNTPRSFLAKAYAVRALTPGPLRCDLRVGDLAHPEASALRRHSRVWKAGAWLAAGLIMLAAGFGWGKAIEAREVRARRAVTERAVAIGGILGKRQPVQAGYELRAVSNMLAEAAPSLEPFARAMAPSRGRSLARFLAEARDAGAVLHRMEWTDLRFAISGKAENETAAERLARTMEQETGWTVTVQSDRKSEHEFHFTLEAAAPR